MTDLEQRAKNGDEDAFAQLVLDNQKRVYNQALRMVKHPSDAEDVAQEAFLNAWKGMDFFKGDCTFATWMHRLTQNAAIDFLRRRRAIQDEAVSLEDEEVVMTTLWIFAAFTPDDLVPAAVDAILVPSAASPYA